MFVCRVTVTARGKYVRVREVHTSSLRIFAHQLSGVEPTSVTETHRMCMVYSLRASRKSVYACPFATYLNDLWLEISRLLQCPPCASDRPTAQPTDRPNRRTDRVDRPTRPIGRPTEQPTSRPTDQSPPD